MEADPARGSRNRRKIDILGMMVSIIGSKDQLVNEHRIMLAEKLLNKSDYDIDSEIRTLELLKVCYLIFLHSVGFFTSLAVMGCRTTAYTDLALLHHHAKGSLLSQSFFLSYFLDSFWRKQHAEMRNHA